MICDVIITGGGLAGLMAGIQLTKAGRSVILFTKGMSSLHFATGCIDLYSAGGDEPFHVIDTLENEHPYSKCGSEMIHQAIRSFIEITQQEGLSYTVAKRTNLKRVSASGRIVPTWLAPTNTPLVERKDKKILITNFKGYNGFHPAIIQKNLQKEIQNIRIYEIPIPIDSITGNKMTDDQGTMIKIIAEWILQNANDMEEIILPSLPGLLGEIATRKELEMATGKKICFISPLPPSIEGQLLERALRDHFSAAGGILITGDEIVRSEYTKNTLTHVYTSSGKSLQANHFILATGSFLSGGLVYSNPVYTEPVFDLEVSGPVELSDPHFFHTQPFLKAGVNTDHSLRGIHRKGHVISNLWCAGAVLGNYNSLAEGSGGGVSLATGYTCAQRILHAN